MRQNIGDNNILFAQLHFIIKMEFYGNTNFSSTTYEEIWQLIMQVIHQNMLLSLMN